MKAKTKFGLNGFTGNVDGMIYYTLPNSDVMIGRRKPSHFTQSSHHKDYRLIAQNLKKLQPSEAYKDDFKVYASLYKELPASDKGVNGWYNLYIRMMWAMQKEGLANLKTINRKQIYDNSLPCLCLRDAIEAGLLPEVVNYDKLDNGI